MLAVWLFVALWAVLGLSLFFVAIRGGIGGARAALQSQTLGARKAAAVTFAVVYVGFGIALPAIFLSGNHANANAQVGGNKLTKSEKHGRELFGKYCAVCHTLSAANAIGKVGPNLDTLQPSASLVLRTINNGCVQSPPPGSPQACLGQGTMPADLVEGQDAQDVANFVSRVAGKE